ncbi:MAG: hypothetical protein BWZ10_02269 [candidate division BRC1 bacterium ADurb.BinA364]|nr:MAG: hypothetical protein BWZ10_02269 [candidate division BRC1 bacterium ADurb.BinA364]
MNIPDPAQPGGPVLRLAEFVFAIGDAPTPQCHASTIAETPSGLVAAWFGGTREKNPDVGIWVSRLQGGAWSPPVEAANGIQGPGERYPCWNPVLFQPQEGPLLLFYKIGPDPRHWRGMMSRSADEGRSWSAPAVLGEGPLGPLVGPVKNKPIQLSDGAIFCPSAMERPNWKAHFELTRDLGRTWETIGPVENPEGLDAIQPTILTHPAGRMQALCRSSHGVIAQSWSEDGGRAWSPLSATTLPNPNSGIDAVSLRDGRHLLVYNHTHREGVFPSGRNMLNVAISRDGADWRPVLTLEKAPGEFSYPSVIQAADGAVHIVYTYLRKTIKHAVLNPGAIAAAD